MKKRVKLICLPFAGGSSFAFYRFKKYLPEWVDLVMVDYPGHGPRIDEPLCTDMKTLVDDVYRQVKPYTDEPYALFGHSMGATVALLLTRKLDAEGCRLPRHLLATGHGGPAAPTEREVPRYQLSDEDLIEEIRGFKGLPEDILENETFLDFCLPMIRADLKVYETFEYKPYKKLPVPVTCVIGDKEDFTFEQIQAWQLESLEELEQMKLPGYHFFINDHEEELMGFLINRLSLAVEREYMATCH